VFVVGGVAVLVEQKQQPVGGLAQRLGGIPRRYARQILVDLHAGGRVDEDRHVGEALADDRHMLAADVAACLCG
jgi:hypothetical protein